MGHFDTVNSRNIYKGHSCFYSRINLKGHSNIANSRHDFKGHSWLYLRIILTISRVTLVALFKDNFSEFKGHSRGEDKSHEL